MFFKPARRASTVAKTLARSWDFHPLLLLSLSATALSQLLVELESALAGLPSGLAYLPRAEMGPLRGFSLKFCSTQFPQNSLAKFKRYLAFPALNQVGKKQKSKKNTSSKLFCTSFFFKTPRFSKKSSLIWSFFRDQRNGSKWHDRKINMKEILCQSIFHGFCP